MAAYRKADIFVRERSAGMLSETDDGYVFVYNAEYLASCDASPISLTMPLQAEPYVSKTLFAFFDGLIPEGWLLDITVRNWKLEINDRFGILLAACRDCVGCVSVREVLQ